MLAVFKSLKLAVLTAYHVFSRSDVTKDVSNLAVKINDKWSKVVSSNKKYLVIVGTSHISWIPCLEFDEKKFISLA